jgi:hypothetical protein
VKNAMICRFGRRRTQNLNAKNVVIQKPYRLQRKKNVESHSAMDEMVMVNGPGGLVLF